MRRRACEGRCERRGGVGPFGRSLRERPTGAWHFALRPNDLTPDLQPQGRMRTKT